MGLAEFTKSKKYKNLMAKLYGIGASVVIVGAMFKIEHWTGADTMLIIGLSTEAIIFFFSAFEPPHEEVDWSLVYPELAGMHEPGDRKKKLKADPMAQQLDKMLADAKIGPELLQSLGTGLKSLGDSANKMADMSQAVAANKEYADNVKTASKSVVDLSASYNKASEAMKGFNINSGDVKAYGEQMSSAGKNLAALNAIYELQLQDSNKHLKETSKFYEGINTLMASLNSSVEDTKKYKDEVGKLAKNLTTLNTVYGNMLSAMQVKQ
jgi:gliding motility-associated protein GldL